MVVLSEARSRASCSGSGYCGAIWSVCSEDDGIFGQVYGLRVVGMEQGKRSEGNSVVWQVTVYGKVSCSVRAGMLGLYWRPGNKA